MTENATETETETANRRADLERDASTDRARHQEEERSQRSGGLDGFELELTLPPALELLGLLEVGITATATAKPQQDAPGPRSALEAATRAAAPEPQPQPAGPVAVALTIDDEARIALQGGDFASSEGGLRAGLGSEGSGQLEARLRAMRSGVIGVAAELLDASGARVGERREGRVEVAEAAVEWGLETVHRGAGGTEARFPGASTLAMSAPSADGAIPGDTVELQARLSGVDVEGLAAVAHGVRVEGGTGADSVVSLSGLQLQAGESVEATLEATTRGEFELELGWGLDGAIEGRATTATAAVTGRVLEPISPSGFNDFLQPAIEAALEVTHARERAELLLDGIGRILDARDGVTAVQLAIEQQQAAQKEASGRAAALTKVTAMLSAVAALTNPLGMSIDALLPLAEGLSKGLGGHAATMIATGSGVGQINDALGNLEKIGGAVRGGAGGPSAEALLDTSVDRLLGLIDEVANTQIEQQSLQISQGLARAATQLDGVTRHLSASLADRRYLAPPTINDVGRHGHGALREKNAAAASLQQSEAIWKAFVSTDSNSMGTGQQARSVFDLVAKWKNSENPEERGYAETLGVFMVERQKTVDFTGETSFERVRSMGVIGQEVRLGHAYELSEDTVSDVRASLWFTGGNGKAAMEAMDATLKERAPEKLTDGRGVRIDLNTAHALANLGVAKVAGSEQAQVEYQVQGEHALTVRGTRENHDAARMEAMTDWERTLDFNKFAKNHLNEFDRIFRVDARQEQIGSITAATGTGYDIAVGKPRNHLMRHIGAGASPRSGLVEADQDALELGVFAPMMSEDEE